MLAHASIADRRVQAQAEAMPPNVAVGAGVGGNISPV